MKAFILLMLVSMACANSSVNITGNWTVSEFQDSFTTFYFDWAPYIFSILSFGFSFMLTARYSQTLIGGGIGLLFIYFFTGNPVFIAGALLSMILGYLMKYVTG